MTRLLTALAAALTLALVFGPSMVEHVGHGLDRGTFNDDVRQQIFPFFTFTGDGPSGPDLPGQYQLDLMPIGYKLLYRVLMPAIDPEPLSKLLPYVQWLVMLVALASVAWRLGGGVAAVATIALTLQAQVFFARLGGGMPRGFAFPMIAVGLWALVHGRVRLLAALAVAGQAFYFVAATALGLMLAAVLFVVPQKDRGEASGWSVGRRVRLLVFAGTLVAALTVPVWLASSQYGRPLGPGDAGMFPEIGYGGRLSPPDMLPQDRDFRSRIWPEVEYQTASTLRGSGRPIAPALSVRGERAERTLTMWVLLASSVGLVLLAFKDPAARRALVLVGTGIGGYILATAASPYFYVPQRFTIYTLPLCVVAFVPAGGAALAAALLPRVPVPMARVLGVALTAGLGLVYLGGRADARAGYSISLDREAPIYRFVRALPPDALIAGWPGDIIDNVPYVCRRRTFVTRENHMPFYDGYTLEMRRRMHALIEALLGSDSQAPIRLRDDFGVTHLIVDTQLFDTPPEYFAPFGDEITRVWQDSKAKGFASQALPPDAVVLRDGPLLILDLSRLSPRGSPL